MKKEKKYEYFFIYNVLKKVQEKILLESLQQITYF